MSKKQPSWLRLSLDVWRASLEAQHVIGLRLAKLARGGAAALAEINRMASEKVDAALEAQHRAAKSMLTGNSSQIPARTLALYRRGPSPSTGARCGPTAGASAQQRVGGALDDDFWWAEKPDHEIEIPRV